VRTLRRESGITQVQLAQAVGRTGTGVRWTQARLWQVENGEANPDLAAMYAVAAALAELTGRSVRLADLLPETGTADGISLLRAALSGEPVQDLPVAPAIGTIPDPRLTPGWEQVEDRVAAQLGPGSEAFIVEAARKLYGHTGSEERDRRAGPGASPQKRAVQSPAVVAELLEATRREIADSAAHDAALEGH
jgi:transcriptional regulator with XRE-family HTH domain